MEHINKPTILVIVGISGDLAQRKLLPAIQAIAHAGILPEHFRVVGITRRDNLTIDDVIPKKGDLAFLKDHLELYTMNVATPNDYVALAQHLSDIESTFGAAAQRLFYLSVPPQASQPVIEHLGASGLAKVNETKLLLEKPFGTDLESAEDLVARITRHFTEDQIYRIDHYLAKEMAQNLIAFRHSNPLFRCTWSKEFIEKIEIVALETIDIEGRIGFYEQTGALRDVVQSHLLQLAALTLMDVSDPMHQIPELRLKALQNLLPPDDVATNVVRGQYEGYREQVGNADSSTETFVSLNLRSKDPLWEGVPITLVTGKSLSQKTTEIHVHYRQKKDTELANELIMRIQPNEGISLRLWIKEPGYTQNVQQLPLEFSYEQHFDELPDAYERVFVDAMCGDHSLFTTSEEVLESWRILKPIHRTWNMQEDGLILYPVGSELSHIITQANVA